MSGLLDATVFVLITLPFSTVVFPINLIKHLYTHVQLKGAHRKRFRIIKVMSESYKCYELMT